MRTPLRRNSLLTGKNTANSPENAVVKPVLRRISVEFCVSYATAAPKNPLEEQGIIERGSGNLVPC
jgi:hypothetical protein